MLLPACLATSGAVVEQSLPSYNEGAANALNQQLLLNLVRLRYRDTPFFLELGSLSAQQTVSMTASIGGTAAALPASPAGSVTAGLGASVSATPTVVFTPLQGEAFVRRLLAPVPMTSVLTLAQSGWSVARVFELLVERLGSLENAITASGPTPVAAPRYEEFLTLARDLRAVQLAGALQFGTAAGQPAIAFVETPDIGEALGRIRTAFGIRGGGAVVPLLADAALEARDGALRVRTRSLLGALFLLSQSVRPPESHVRAGLVTVTRRPDGATFDWDDALGSLLRIESSATEPTDASIRVRYRGHWFFLRDDDLESKSTFMLLSEVFSMQAGSSSVLAPALTLPLGH